MGTKKDKPETNRNQNTKDSLQKGTSLCVYICMCIYIYREIYIHTKKTTKTQPSIVSKLNTAEPKYIDRYISYKLKTKPREGKVMRQKNNNLSNSPLSYTLSLSHSPPLSLSRSRVCPVGQKGTVTLFRVPLFSTRTPLYLGEERAQSGRRDGHSIRGTTLSNSTPLSLPIHFKTNGSETYGRRMVYRHAPASALPLISTNCEPPGLAGRSL